MTARASVLNLSKQQPGHIGHRASIAWFVLSELLGRRGVRVYDGSWAEWGFMPDASLAVGP